MNIEPLYIGNWIGLYAKNGWEYVERLKGSSAVIIPAITKNDEFIFVEQHRVPLGANCIEWPAGLVGDEGEEEPEEAAVRELLEETGYTSENVAKIFGQYTTSPGLTNEKVDFVVCSDCEKIEEGGGVDGENIKIHLVPKDDVHNWLIEQINAGIQIDSKIYVGLYFLEIFS